MTNIRSNPFTITVHPKPVAHGDITLVTPLVGFREIDPQDDPINPWRRPGGVSPWMNTDGWAHQGLASYSGAAFSEAYGTKGGYVVTGGGHADSFGGEVYVYDIGANKWVRINFPYENTTRTGVMESFYNYVQANPYNLGASSRGMVHVSPSWVDPPGYDSSAGDWDARFPEGTHTYDLTEVLPPSAGGGPQGTLIMLGSGSQAGGGRAARGIWKCPLDTGRWERVMKMPSDVHIDSGDGGTCFDRKRGIIYQLHEGANVYAFDLAQASYTRLSPFPNVVSVETCSAFHEKADLLIHMATFTNAGTTPNTQFPKLYAWSPVTKKATMLNCTGEFPSRSGDQTRGVASRGMGAEYCPADGCLYAFSNGRTPIYDGVADAFSVWRCRPPENAKTTDDYLQGTWVWSLDNKNDYTGARIAPKDMPYFTNGPFKRFRWVPSLRRFLATTYNGDGGIILVKPKGI